MFVKSIEAGLWGLLAGSALPGRSSVDVFGIWTGIAVISGVAALLGFALFRGASPDVVAATTAVAAGAILAMLADTMMPEAFERTTSPDSSPSRASSAPSG
ncbi:MAG TPA: hypothetical protein VHB21_13730 [Minicystis sp.]|nr:hypothetical protein [Minicystis sp.]